MNYYIYTFSCNTVIIIFNNEFHYVFNKNSIIIQS